MKHRIALILLTATVLAACASQGPRERDAEAYELYRDFAGAPIDEFTYLGRYDGWRSLGKNVLAVQTTLSDAYLLDRPGSVLRPPVRKHHRPHVDRQHGTARSRFRARWPHELHHQGDPARELRGAAQGTARGGRAQAGQE